MKNEIKGFNNSDEIQTLIDKNKSSNINVKVIKKMNETGYKIDDIKIMVNILQEIYNVAKDINVTDEEICPIIGTVYNLILDYGLIK